MYNFLANISSVLTDDLDMKSFADSLSRTQLTSKRWLVDTLVAQQFKQHPSILILGGWYGTYLVPMLVEALQPSKIYFNDIDPSCLDVARKLHRNPIIEYCQFDATQHHFDRRVDIVINTSCEHMSSYDQMLQISPGCLFVLQACDNGNDPGHVNISSSTQEFVAKLNLSQVLFAGRRQLGHKNRFMVIGRK